MSTPRKNYKNKKKHIVNSASELFFKQGYNTSSMDEILKAAGISKGTFYHYFPSKEVLLKEIVDQYVGRFIEHFDENFPCGEQSYQSCLNQFISFCVYRPVEQQSDAVNPLTFVHSDLDQEVQRKYEQVWHDGVTPFMHALLDCGQQAQKIDVANTEQSAKLVMHLVLQLQSFIYQQTGGLQNGDKLPHEVLETYRQCIERTLGLPSDQLQIDIVTMQTVNQRIIKSRLTGT